jgi:hypothetical protein
MTDYTKSTNFATKDSLPSGNPAKIVKGTEINTEFDNIAVSIATKADNSSPSFTGTLTASDLVVTGDTTLGNAATDTVTITADVASNIIPSADSTYTLGDASNYWSHGYMDAATITGNLAIGGDIAVTGNATITGNLTFGNADTDSITLTAEVASNITPDVDNTYDLGTATKEWRNLYVDGTAYVDAIDFNGTAITATGAELNTLDGITANVTELNYTDGVTSNIQTQLDNKQPLSAVLTATTASFTTADETKLDAIEAGATADQTASEILTAVKTVDGAGSGLDADLLDGNEATAFATAAQGTLADSALQSSDIGVSVQGYDATILVDADIGANVLAYDSNLQSFVTTFTLPTTDSTAGYVLKTDGAGALSFVAQADYDESTVAITGGTIDGTVIGGTTPAAGDFTTLGSTGNLTVTGLAKATKPGIAGEFHNTTAAGANNTILDLRYNTSTTPGHSGDIDFKNIAGTAVSRISSEIVSGSTVDLVLAPFNSSISEGLRVSALNGVSTTGTLASGAFTASGNIDGDFTTSVYNANTGASADAQLRLQCNTKYVDLFVNYNGSYFQESSKGTGVTAKYSDFDTNYFRTTAGAEIANFSSTGLDLNGDLTFSNTNPVILGADVDGGLYISGGSSSGSGANIILFGESHATVANDIRFRNGATIVGQYDSSATTWNFQDNDITTTGSISDEYGNVRDVPAVGTKFTAYTLQAADAGRYVQTSSGATITIPNSVFSQGDVVTILNAHTSDSTITCNTSFSFITGDVTNKASVTLAARGICTLLFTSATVVYMSGNLS